MNRVASARSPSSRLADWLLPPPPGGRGGVLARLAVAADERAFDAYLLLVRNAGPAADGFFVNLESLGDALGLPAGWDDTAVR
ncbi:MAG: hypothetical protein HY594_02050, partial [Candidatus Omnitrophica bacterium]|nr:hypothetical protein [Candidatus Omnitrophota bacterium]